MPGASEALRVLAGLGVQCVASNAVESDGGMVAAALDRVGLRDHFTHFFTSSELGVSKPEPRFFREVARGLGIPPANLLAIGNDLHKDVLPAKAVGMTTVLVMDPGAEPPHEGVDLIVPDLAHLARHVRSGIRDATP